MKYLITITLGLFLGMTSVSNAQIIKNKEAIKKEKNNTVQQKPLHTEMLLKKHINLISPLKTDKNVAVDASLIWEIEQESNNDINPQILTRALFDVYFGTDANPTKVSSAQIERSYKPTLEHNTTYFWKIEITGSNDVQDKSLVHSFKTLPFIQWNDDKFGTFTDPRDDKTYKVVKIGEQVWFAENLAYLPKITPYTPEITAYKYYGSGARDHYVYDYRGVSIEDAKSTYNYKTYGVLYDWEAAMNYKPATNNNPSGVQGACPCGWHVPSLGEWQQLKKAVWNNGEAPDLKMGKALASNTIWETSGGKPGTVAYRHTNNSTGTGFNALPSGWGEIHSSNEGTYIVHKEIGNWTIFWTTSPAWHEHDWKSRRFSQSIVKRRGDVKLHEKKVSEALSVRCVKD